MPQIRQQALVEDSTATMYQRVDGVRVPVDIIFLFGVHLIIPSVQECLDSTVNEVLCFMTIVGDQYGRDQDNNLNDVSVRFVDLFQKLV